MFIILIEILKIYFEFITRNRNSYQNWGILQYRDETPQTAPPTGGAPLAPYMPPEGPLQSENCTNFVEFT